MKDTVAIALITAASTLSAGAITGGFAFGVPVDKLASRRYGLVKTESSSELLDIERPVVTLTSVFSI